MDANSVIWLCNEDALYLYDSNTQKVTFIQNEIGDVYKRQRQDHVLVELYGSIRTAENEIAVFPQGA